MFPPKQMHPGQPAQAAPQGQPSPPAAPPPGAGAPPSPGDAPRAGPQKVSNIEFNQQIQNILMSRIEAMGSKNPQVFAPLEQAIKSVPGAAQVFGQIIPELVPIMVSLGWIQGGQGPGAAAGGQPATPGGQPPGGGAPAGGPPPPPNQVPTPPASAAVSQDPNAAEEDGEDNPLARDRSASPGLTG